MRMPKVSALIICMPQCGRSRSTSMGNRHHLTPVPDPCKGPAPPQHAGTAAASQVTNRADVYSDGSRVFAPSYLSPHLADYVYSRAQY
jgi:hypothetical protein